jgi:cob(I)alamin adenosyltransferase
MEESEEERHARKMLAKKRLRDRQLETKTEERGLLMVHTGKGKGKTTAAMGLVLRALGQGMRVGIVQFVKGVWDTGERRMLEEKFSGSCEIYAMGEGFTWDTQDLARDREAARKALDRVGEMLRRDFDVVVLDEVNIVLRYGYLGVSDVLDLVGGRREMQHVVLTGRNARPEVLEAADLVTEMVEVKHPYRSGVKAQRGIEY